MRRHRIEVLTLTFILASAAAVAARAQESPRVRIRTRPGMVVVADSIRLDGRRGRLGITVDMRPDASRDSIGARVAGITTPNSAAARADIQVGDIVTRFNGTPLGVTDGRSGDEEEQSRPAMRLINLASRLSAGDTVRLDLKRGSQNVNATLVAGESDVDMMVEHMRMPGMEFGPMKMQGGLEGPMPGMLGMPGMDGQMRVFISGGPISDLELVKVNPGLGEYFGTQEGLLVVNVGQDSALGLRAGDVILAIGGRRPASPPQAMRILGTYEPDETVQFDVMRQRHRVSVSGKIPQREEHGWSVRRDNFEFEMPMETQMEQMHRMRETPNMELMMPQMRRHPEHLMRISGEV
jgi:hypothetical protein